MAKKQDKGSKKNDKKHGKKKDLKHAKLKGLKQDKAPTVGRPEVIRPPLREVQSALKQGYRDDPDSALLTSAVFSTTGATATSGGEDPTRVRIKVDSPAGTTFDIGAHVAVGGLEDLPCSGDVFLASLAACQELTIRLVAAAMGIELKRLGLRVEGDWDVRGTLAVSRESPIGFTAIRVLVDLDVDAPADKIARLLSSAERFCVVSATLKDAPPVELIATIEGAPVGEAAAD